MNIFFRELKSHQKSLIFWIIGMIFLIGSGMAKYAAYSTSGKSINSLISQLPKAVQTIVGLGTFDLSTAGGFYGVLFLYIALLVTVHASLLGTDLISKEERDKTVEFLFAKPISRANVITAKLCAGIVNILILNIVTFVISLLIVGYYSKGQSITHEISILTFGLLFLQLVYFALGSAIASISNNPKSTSGWTTAILLITFILFILIDVNTKLEPLKYFTPFRYFDAKSLINGPGIEPIYLILSLGIIIVSLIITYRFFQNRDLTI